MFAGRVDAESLARNFRETAFNGLANARCRRCGSSGCGDEQKKIFVGMIGVYAIHTLGHTET